MSVMDSKEIVRRSYLAYETGDLDSLDEVMAVSYVDHNAIPGQEPGLAGVKKKVADTRAALGELSIDFEEQVEEGDMVASRLRIHTAQGDIVVFTMSRLEEGKVAAEWGLADTSALGGD
jgi:ketosteroid isomerase-like protein